MLTRSGLLFLLAAAMVPTQSFAQITIGIVDERNFCLMVPPKPGDNVGNTEGSSVARCMGNVPGSNSAGPLPDGFITSAHLVEVPGHVQITGTFDRSKYNLSPSDGGGQYDDALHGSRPGSMCANYPHYLEYLEPDQGIFCVRCCTDGDCDISQDTIGCRARMGGNYGPGFTNSRSGSVAPQPSAPNNSSPPPPSSSSPAPVAETQTATASSTATIQSATVTAVSTSSTTQATEPGTNLLSTSTILSATAQVTSGGSLAPIALMSISKSIVMTSFVFLGFTSFVLVL